VAKAAGA